MKAICVHCRSKKTVEPKKDKRRIAVICLKCHNKRRDKVMRVRLEEKRLNEEGNNV